MGSSLPVIVSPVDASTKASTSGFSLLRRSLSCKFQAVLIFVVDKFLEE